MLPIIDPSVIMVDHHGAVQINEAALAKFLSSKVIQHDDLAVNAGCGGSNGSCGNSGCSGTNGGCANAGCKKVGPTAPGRTETIGIDSVAQIVA